MILIATCSFCHAIYFPSLANFHYANFIKDFRRHFTTLLALNLAETTHTLSVMFACIVFNDSHIELGGDLISKPKEFRWHVFRNNRNSWENGFQGMGHTHYLVFDYFNSFRSFWHDEYISILSPKGNNCDSISVRNRINRDWNNFTTATISIWFSWNICWRFIIDGSAYLLLLFKCKKIVQEIQSKLF